MLLRELPCILSGGTEGVLSPHYVVFARSGRPEAWGTRPAAPVRSASAPR